MTPTILITRPEPANVQFADEIRGRLGCAASILLSPVLQIDFTGALPDLDPFGGLIFTSRNGVRAFAAKTKRRNITCYCVGDATAATAERIGFTAISARGAADDLVDMLKTKGVSEPLLHIRGEHARGDIALRLTQAGLPTTEAVLYRQIPIALSQDALGVLSGEVPVILPLFSPRSAALVVSQTTFSAPIHVAAISKNVAAILSDGFANQVLIARNPDAASMLDVIQDLFDQGKALERGNLAQ